MAFKLLDLGGDPEDLQGYNGKKYYRLATITWSKPTVWEPDANFAVPDGWVGFGGVYAFIRYHQNQSYGPQIAYIGKANQFEKRLTTRHQHFEIVQRNGETKVSCGRIMFRRIESNTRYYSEIEDLIKLALWSSIENKRSLESLPGFRGSQPRSMKPWVITNEGFRFGGVLPKRIVYPSIAVGN